MKSISAIVLSVLLTACVTAYVPEPLPPPSLNAKLQRGQAVLVATPVNGKFEEEDYPDSGQQAAEVVRLAFSRFASKAEISKTCKAVDCLANEGRGKYRYYIVPEILHWEDRETQWSGKPDKVSLKITVVDATTMQAIDSVVIRQEAAWAVLGGMHPELLLPQPVNQHVASLY